jgi:hypothetical protein
MTAGVNETRTIDQCQILKKSVTTGVGDTSSKSTAGVIDAGEQVIAGVDDGESTVS